MESAQHPCDNYATAPLPHAPPSQVGILEAANDPSGWSIQGFQKFQPKEVAAPIRTRPAASSGPGLHGALIRGEAS